MEPSDLSVFRRLNARMQWLTERQALLAQNVANVDTPGYRSRDMKAPTFDEAMALAAPSSRPTPPTAAPRSGHIALVSKMAPAGTNEFRKSQESTISGNTVDLEHELKKASDAALEYQTMTHLYRKHMEMLRTAVRANGS